MEALLLGVSVGRYAPPERLKRNSPPKEVGDIVARVYSIVLNLSITGEYTRVFFVKKKGGLNEN